MARVEQFKFFSYTWSSSEEETNEGKRCLIRAYGWNEKLETADLVIEQFLLPVIIELDENITWTPGAVNAVKNRLQQLNSKRDMQPVKIDYEERQRLYYAYVEKLKTVEPKTGRKYKHKQFPYLIAWFYSSSACSSFAATLARREIDIVGIGKIRLRCHGTGKKITPVLKFLGIRELPSAGWMRGAGIKATKADQESTRKHEYFVNFQDLVALSEEEAMKMPIPQPKIMSFDNEANSTYMNSMPKPHRPGDKTFQIGYTILDPPSEGRKKAYRKHLISMGNPDDIEGVTIFRVKTEADVYVTLVQKMREEDPEVVLGFNILGWDINYMIQRCKTFCRCFGEFDLMGCIIGKHAEQAEISWGSKGAGKNKFEYLDAEGRVFIDLLPYIKRNYKLDNYRLATCCEELLKTSNKDDLKPKDIFKAWRKHNAAMDNPGDKQLQKEASADLGKVGKYCVQDSWVTLLLYEKLSVWADLTESATVCQVPMFYMFTEGQQIKMYSQVYRYGFHNKITVESNGYVAKDDEHYTGAYVTEPKKGLYRKIVPFDFAGLYPSIMMAHNIDHSKLVIDPSIPDEDCWVMEWEEHQYCSPCPLDEFPGQKAPKTKEGATKRVCAKYKYRWLRHDVSGKGVVPTLLEGLISARKKTRKIIAANETEIKILKKILGNEPLSDEHFSALKEILKTFASNKDSNEALQIVQNKFEKGLLLRETPLHTSASDTKSKPNILTGEERIKISERIEQLESLNLVLDRRQNAYKVNANSMYGAMGVREGYLPFLPGAMCVTYMGRTNIKRVNKFIEEEKNGIVIYNDTDSAYCFFPDFENKSIRELWAYAKQIVAEVKILFPPPISLEFEEKVYEKFLILTKKRYAAIAINEEGKIDSKLVKRGIILQRRDNCISGNSLVTLSNGTSKKIMNLIKTDHQVLGWNGNDGLIPSKQTGFKYQGKQQCLKIILVDGRELVCTPDHKILAINRDNKPTWKDAKDLNKIEDKIICSLESPEDIEEVDEVDWKLHVGNHKFTLRSNDTMSDDEKIIEHDRNQTLAFMRILGYLNADGNINKRDDGRIDSSVALGHKIDADSMVNDISLISGRSPSIIFRDTARSSFYQVKIPRYISEIILSLSGQSEGKRCDSPASWPNFILDPKCPKAVVREFVSGVLGGDGHTAYLTKDKSGLILCHRIILAMSTKEEFKNDMLNKMNNFCVLMSRFGIDCQTLEKPEMYYIKNCKNKENKRFMYRIKMNASDKSEFLKKIGFRYCIHKQMRLTAAQTYWKHMSISVSQRASVVYKAIEFIDEQKLSRGNAIAEAKKYVKNSVAVLNDEMIDSVGKTVVDVCRKEKRNGQSPRKNIYLSSRVPHIKPDQWFKDMNCFAWFRDDEVSRTYAVSRDRVSVPYVVLPICNIANDGEHDVYDISVNETESFLANGIVVHNCRGLRDAYQALIYKIFEQHEQLIKFKKDVKLIQDAENIEIASWKEKCEQLVREYAKKNDCEDILDTLLGKFYRKYKIKQKSKPRIKAEKTEEKPKKKKAAPKSFDRIEFPTHPELKSRKFAMNNPAVKNLLGLIIDSIRDLFQWKYGYKHFVITKQITRDVKEYKNPAKLPGHVKLGMRMQKRGIPVGGGTRVEYLILKHGPYKKTETQSDKIEDVNYFSEFREILRIELLSYLKQFINPIDELCTVVMSLEGFVKEQFEIRIAHSQMTDQISELNKPKLEFIN